MEKCKKLFWTFGSVLIVVFALIFSSCSEDDGGGGKDKNDVSGLIGTWRFNDDGIYYVTFRTDGIGRYEDDFEDSLFEYTYNEKNSLLILDFGDGDAEILNVVSVTSSELILKDPEDGYTSIGVKIE